jgi:hypothetical protein
MTYTAYASEVDPPKIPAPPSAWANPAVVDRLKELWATHSCTQICGAIWSEFNVKVSRNAVIGKLHRLGIGIEAKTHVHPLTRDRIAATGGQLKPRKRKPRAVAHAPKPRVTHESPEIKVMRCAEVVELHISLDELTHTNCHWPSGNGPFTFCGNAALKGRSYCPSHFALSIKPGWRA